MNKQRRKRVRALAIHLDEHYNELKAILEDEERAVWDGHKSDLWACLLREGVMGLDQCVSAISDLCFDD